jgi:hypothetical protein
MRAYSTVLVSVQCEDPTFDVDGDSGVIGTVKSTDSSLHLDIKGQASHPAPRLDSIPFSFRSD